MPPRQSVSSVARVRTASEASPASGRRSSSPIAAERSAAATSRHWDDVRTLWSRRRPVSQSGYQSRSARPLTASPRRPSWSRTRSRSLAGPASRRATLPTTASATPSCRSRPLPVSARSQAEARARSTRSARAARRFGPEDRTASARRSRRRSRGGDAGAVSSITWKSSPQTGDGPDPPGPGARRVPTRRRGTWITGRLRRARRCARARPRRPGRPRPCRRRSGPSARP